MKIRNAWGIVLGGLLGLAPVASAQVPAVPAVPVVPVAPVAAPLAPGVAPMAAPRNIWSFLCMTPEQRAACRQKICDCPLGQLLNNSLAPATAFTGGLVPPLCPPVDPRDLMKPPDSAEGAAAQVKADEAAAKKRRAAVRYLGTVDCRYWPEAQDALINSLRADRNECVRLEATFSLGRGCCCNKKTMVALILTVTGSDEDGNPSEPSERVRVSAEAALRRCVDCYVEIKPVVPQKKVQILPLPMPEEVDSDKPKPKKNGEPEVLPVPDDKDQDLKEKTGPKQKKKPGPEDDPEETPKNGEKKTELLPAPNHDVRHTSAVLPSRMPFYQRVERLSREQIVATAQKALKSLPATTNVPPPGVASSGKSLVEIVNHAWHGQSTGAAGGTPATGAPELAPASASVTSPTSNQVAPAHVVPVPSSPIPQAGQTGQPRGFVPMMLEGKSGAPSASERRPTRGGSNSGILRVFGSPTASAPAVPMAQPVQTAQLSAPQQDAAPVAPATYASLDQPVAGSVAPAIHVDVPASPYAPAAPVEVASRVESSAVPGSPTSDLLNVLRFGEEPERRTWAAAQLGMVREAAREMEVVEVLLERSENDSSLMVRLTCLNAIQRRGTPHYQIPEVMRRLANDPNPSVRRKAAEVESGMKVEPVRGAGVTLLPAR